MPQTPASPSRRRTQAERSDAMRQRLIMATLECLAQEGYKATTVSAVVKRAGVSRGAHVHHYPNKDALILDAAAYLLRRAYRTLGEVLLGIANENDRLQALLDTTWSDIFDTRMMMAYFELLLASQHNPKLGKALRALTQNSLGNLQIAVTHYFEPRGNGAENPVDLFVLTTLVFSGAILGKHVYGNTQDIERYLHTWTRLMGSQMRARRGVTAPPPRPVDWDRFDTHR